MKKNSFDPFMINNFSNITKQSKFSSLSTSDVVNEDLIGMTFMEKSINMSIPKVRAGLVLLVSSDSFGENNDLGNNLIKGFFDSIASGLELPEYVFLVNTAVKVLQDKDIVNILKKVKKYGTNVISSLESIEYFNILDESRTFQKWSIGDITTILMNANKVIKI